MTSYITHTQAIRAAKGPSRFRRKDSPKAIIIAWLGISETDADIIIADLEDAGFDLEGMPPQALKDLAYETFRMLDQEGLLSDD